MNQTILIIDDDDKLNRLLAKFLADFNLRVISAVTPTKGLDLLKTQGPDLVILDVMLPEMDGFEVCRIIRRTSRVPVIMLTARGDLADKVVGLELGADDYLPKPFEPRELVARIQSVLRRTSQGSPEEPGHYGPITIDFSRREARLRGQALDLTTNEFTLLAFMAANPGRVLTRDQLLQELSGIDCEAYNRTVDVTMSRLRHKLDDDPKNPCFIKTVWGSGYLFMGKDEKI